MFLAQALTVASLYYQSGLYYLRWHSVQGFDSIKPMTVVEVEIASL